MKLRWAWPALSLVLVGVFWLLGRPVEIDEAAWRQRVAEEYVATWSRLDAAAAGAAADVGRLLAEEAPNPDSDLDPAGERLTLFRRLSPLVVEPATTLLLLDPDGEAVAWTGEGLLHEPAGWDLPAAGHAVRRGVTATTLMSVVPVSEERRPWRLVAGLSLPARPFPFDEVELERPVRWSVSAADSFRPPPDSRLWRLGSGLEGGANGSPWSTEPLWIDAGETPLRRAGHPPYWLRPAIAVVLAFTLLSMALSAGADRPAATLLLAAAGVAAPALILGVPGLPAAVLTAVVVLASFRALRPDLVLPGVGPGSRWPTALWAAAGFAVCSALSWWLQAEQGRIVLSDLELVDLLQPASGAAAWLLASVGWLLAMLSWVADSRGLVDAGETESPLPGADTDAPGWLAAATVLAAGAGLDTPWLGWGLGTVACILAARWWQLRSVGGLGRRTAFTGLTLMAALLASVAWQTGQRLVLRQSAAELLPELRPPSLEERNDLLVALHQHFQGFDVGEVLPPPAALEASVTAANTEESLDGTPSGELQTELEDLAFALWRDSPLTHRDGLSALTVAPLRSSSNVSGTGSSFAFGLALGPRGPTPQAARWPIPPADAWRDALSGGEETLWLGGEPWGAVRYWFQPRPGFRLETDEIEELQANLVRGGPRRPAADGLPEPVRYALYDLDGRALVSPWRESPPLPQSVHERLLDAEGLVSMQLKTPTGLAHAWMRVGSDGIETLYLPRLGLRGGLEAVGSQALASLVLLLALALLALGLGTLASSRPRAVVRSWLEDLIRSYSKRLILVYTVLLLMPLVALNLVLLRGFGERMRAEQLEAAESAVVSARSFVVDYLLGLEPGFLFETQINRELLEWISDLVGHQVNLYWGSRLWASSQEELFTAGLLPRRIPGEIYTRLALLGYDTGFRTQATGGLTYLEVYAPLDVPGIASSQQGLFLSVPLLEREEEVSRELQAMRRRAFLISAGLFVLLVAVGGRLARRFTRPIVELIDGTRRIARGERLQPVRPKERELEALAEAIGVMSDQVSESRRKLTQEKQFVERVVAHIDAAVVSLDRRGRVLVQNRVAEEMLGIRAGDLLDDVLSSSEELAPVAEFLDGARRGGLALETAVKIRPAGDKVEIHEWALTWIPLPGEEDPVELMVVDDATEVLRNQRLEAWVEMARIIAHEIKNPLTPIRLSTEHLQQVWRRNPENFGEVLDRCVDNIVRNVDELREIASEFSIYSRIPLAELQPGDVGELVARTAESYRHVSERGVELEVLLPAEDDGKLVAPMDGKLLARAVRNLLENSLRAVAPPVPMTDAEREGSRRRVTLAARRRGGSVEIEVADTGPGVDPQKLERIFEPYFSTHETGTGLGLAITRRIVEQHSGRVEAQNRTEGGLSVVISLPAREGRGATAGTADGDSEPEDAPHDDSEVP